MNLMAMADELNRKYFLGILNIDGVTITNKKASCYPNRNDLTAYYLGDRLGGKIFFIAERLHSLDSSTIRRIIFCEMAQQLDLNSDHVPHFQMLMKRYEGGATEQESLEFAWALKRNIELKAKNGRLNNSAMLPAVAKVCHSQNYTGEDKGRHQRHFQDTCRICRLHRACQRSWRYSNRTDIRTCYHQ